MWPFDVSRALSRRVEALERDKEVRECSHVEVEYWFQCLGSCWFDDEPIVTCKKCNHELASGNIDARTFMIERYERFAMEYKNALAKYKEHLTQEIPHERKD